VLRRGGELGWVVGCSLRGERWDGEEGGEIEQESRQSGYIFTFADGITDGHIPSVYLLVSPPVTVPRHCTEIPV
jgi:hypothetical protein